MPAPVQSPQFQRSPHDSPLVGSSPFYATATQARDSDALSDISAQTARSGRSVVSAMGAAAGRAMRSAGSATYHAGQRMFRSTRTFFTGNRTGMPKAARNVPMADLDAIRQEWAHDAPSRSAGFGTSSPGHVTRTTDGQKISWTPTHLWKTSPFEYRACQVLNRDEDRATVVDNTGVYVISQSDLQELRIEGRATNREQARRTQFSFQEDAGLAHGDPEPWSSSFIEPRHAHVDRIGLSSLSQQLAQQIAAQADRRMTMLSAHILRALIGPRNIFLWADENDTGRFIPVKLLRLVQLHTAPHILVRVDPGHEEMVDICRLYHHSPRHVRMELQMFPLAEWPKSIVPTLRRLITDGDEGLDYTGDHGYNSEARAYEHGGGPSSSPSTHSDHSVPSPHGGPPSITSVTEPAYAAPGGGSRGWQKFDPSKIRTYQGDNCIGDRSKYENRPLPWCRQFVRCAQPQGIREDNYVLCALLCVTTDIAARYEQKQMRPVEAPTTARWERWTKDFPPNPASLLFDNFVKWLCSTFQNPANVEEQRQRFESCAQKHGQSVFDFNNVWNWERELLAELTESYYEQPDVTSVGCEDCARDRQKYMGALLPHIRKEVQTWHSMCKLQPLVTAMPHLSNPLETMATRIRLQKAGNEPTLRALQECALTVEGQLRMRSAFDRFVVQEVRWQPNLSQGSRVSHIPTRARLVAAPTRVPQRTVVPARIQNLEWVPEDGEDAGMVLAHLQQGGYIDDTEMLFNHLQQSGRIAWSKAQMRKLFDENRCFKCAKQGHQKADCRNPAANPAEFHAIEVEDAPLEHNEQFFHLLTDFLPGNDSGAGSQ